MGVVSPSGIQFSTRNLPVELLMLCDSATHMLLINHRPSRNSLTLEEVRSTVRVNLVLSFLYFITEEHKERNAWYMILT